MSKQINYITKEATKLLSLIPFPIDKNENEEHQNLLCLIPIAAENPEKLCEIIEKEIIAKLHLWRKKYPNNNEYNFCFHDAVSILLTIASFEMGLKFDRIQDRVSEMEYKIEQFPKKKAKSQRAKREPAN